MKIIIEEYQAEWVDKFLSEKERLGSILGDFKPAIEHIGSTSVLGLCAKATIDILVGLQAKNQLDQVIEPMINGDYTYFKKYEPPMPYRRLFSKLKPLQGQALPKLVDVGDEFVRGEPFFPLYNIHIMVKDTPHWKRHIAFRDFLRAHSDIRDEYGRLKKELSKFDYKDTNDYNQAKDSFIKKKETNALDWYSIQNKR